MKSGPCHEQAMAIKQSHGQAISLSANIDIRYIGIRQISVKMHGYRPKYWHISAKIPVIGQISVKMKISVSVSVADMLVQIYLYRYQQKYQLGEYICIGIGIGRNHIGTTLVYWFGKVASIGAISGHRSWLLQLKI